MNKMSSMSLRNRVAIGAAAFAVVGAGAFGTVAAAADTSAAAAQPPASVSGKDTRQSTHLTEAAALRGAQAALAAAEKEGQRVSVAVVDRDGRVLVQLRGDGSGPQSFESAEKKAYTAVSWNARTSELVKRLEQTPTLKDIPGTLFLGGGAPVAVKGAPIAGIGVAGAPSGELDEKFALAGVAELTE